MRKLPRDRNRVKEGELLESPRSNSYNLSLPRYDDLLGELRESEGRALS